jgi:hypothetical protein
VRFGRALLRNTLKIAIPWELGHTVALGLADTGRAAAGGGAVVVPPWLWAVTGATYAMVIVYVGALFTGSRRTPYDRLSRTRVVAVPA